VHARPCSISSWVACCAAIAVSSFATVTGLPDASAGLTQCTGVLIPQAVCDANKGMKSVVVDVADPKSVQVLARSLKADRRLPQLTGGCPSNLEKHHNGCPPV